MTYEESLHQYLDWDNRVAANATDRWIMRAQYLLDRALKWPDCEQVTDDSTTTEMDISDAFALSTSDAGGCRCKDPHDDPTADHCLVAIVIAASAAAIDMHSLTGDALAAVMWDSLDSDIWADDLDGDYIDHTGHPHHALWLADQAAREQAATA